VGKAKRVAIYLRVSTTGQTVENQKRELDVESQQVVLG
jgi:DNA invertase Pin-like site-specific DNA recombinase